ncbi:MAG: clostripain-related cysteine peptidase [Spirochaetes bacterium]|nr:clostripain-related cysteine peptidase [Spirochaetota bacterium]
MQKLLTLVLIVSLMFISSCTFSDDSSDGSGDSGINRYENYVTRSSVEWVIMVYLDGDNNLESYLNADFNEMEQGLYDLQQNYPSEYDEVRIVVFYDRISGYYTGDGDWTNTRFYEAEPDNDSSTINSTIIANYDELNMGTAETLTFFIDKAITYYPANKYSLIISNHGDGARSSSTLPSSPALSRGGVSDDTDNGYLYLDQFREAFAEVSAKNLSVDKLDIISFDCCLMATTEVAYELRNYGEYFVASMANESGYGWDYERIIEDLAASTITAENFAIKIVDEYEAFHSASGYTNQTLSASNLSNIAALKTAIDSLGDAMYDESQKTSLESTREASVNFFESNNTISVSCPYFDLDDFCDNIVAGGYSPGLSTAANNVITALDAVIVKAYAGSYYGGYHDTGSRGLSIFFSRGNLIYYSSSHYAYQWWYTSLDTQSQYGSSFKYGNVDFCTYDDDGNVETWKELHEAWYDSSDSYNDDTW